MAQDLEELEQLSQSLEQINESLEKVNLTLESKVQDLQEQLVKMELKAVEERPLTSTPKKQVQFDDNQEISQTLKFHEAQVIKQELKIEKLKQEFLEKKQSLADKESKNYIEKRKDSNTKIKLKIEDMKCDIN